MRAEPSRSPPLLISSSSKMEAFSQESVIEEFEALTKDAGRAQEETLRRILQENGKAEYLQKLGLGGRTDPESFKSCVPLVNHSDLAPYIQRIADGDDSPILTGKPVSAFSLTTGTTQGKPKFVPWNDELARSSTQIYKTSFAFRNREFPIGTGKALQFFYGSRQVTTKGGLIATTSSTNVFRSDEFRNTIKDIQSQCCSPDEVIFGMDFQQSLYCHLLCGLIYSDEVQVISSTFAHNLVHSFRTFEQIWEELVADIREGVLSSRITIPCMRAAVSKLLSPNPALADWIYNKCVNLSNWYGVIPEIWPNAKYVHGIMTGSMEPYLKKLRHYAGHLPLISGDYASSEGWIGANVNPTLPPESVTFAVLPNIGYYEFIPLMRPKGQELDNAATVDYIEAEPVGLTEVEVGKDYEIVITTFAGLYRYRLGDVLRMAGFHNSMPELQFICRRSLLLSITNDKTTEKDLHLAVEEASKLLEAENLELVDFTSQADTLSEPGRYVIYWELNSEAEAKDDVLSSCCNCLDLSFVDSAYVRSRKARTIGPLELRILRKGTFQTILHHYLSLGTAVSQFKTPRFVSPGNDKVLEILCRNVVTSYFSTAY